MSAVSALPIRSLRVLGLAGALSALSLTACEVPTTIEPPDDEVPAPDVVPEEPAAALDPVASLQELAGACSNDGWCWRRPTPRGVRINAVFATAPDNLWLTGETGYVLQWNGRQWREHVLPEPPFAAAMSFGMVAGRGPSDMWIGSGDLIYRWDGASWTLKTFVPPGVDQSFHGIWEAPNGDVWVTMEYGLVRRSVGGEEFSDLAIEPAQNPFSELGSIWGTAANDVWIAGRPGRMFHWDGSSFSEHATGTYKSGGDLQGTSASDIWIGGYDGTLVHWDGARWSPVDTGLDAGWYIKGVAAVAPNDVHWIAQRSSHEARLLHWNGVRVTNEWLATEVMLSDLAIVDGRWWIPGDHGAVYVRQQGFAPMTPAIEPARESFRAGWGSSDRNLYLVGPSLLAHSDGAEWRQAAVIGINTVNAVTGMRVGQVDEVWAVGSSPGAEPEQTAGDVFHYDGAAWTKSQIDPAHGLNAVWAAAPGEVIAVGDGGTVYRRAGGTWTKLASPVAADLYGVWGPDADHAWIVGAAGTILRWERSTPDALVAEVSPVDTDLHAIHGAGGVRWIATSGLGPDGMVAVLQSSSAGWIRHAVPNLLDAQSVHAISANDVLAVGENNSGRVFRWNGTQFVQQRTGHSGAFYSVFRTTEGSVWIAGPNALLAQEE